MIRKLFIICAILAVGTGLTGCNDWLSLTPKSEIATDDLFKTPEGFTIALNGIYSTLSNNTLYGKELKHGTLDILARVYNIANTTLYNNLERYDYYDYRGTFDQIWSTAYNVIANCNSLIAEVQKKDENFFEPGGKKMIEGEALAIRSMLYLDLLRLFAPAPVVKDEAAIPWYPELVSEPRPMKKTSEILASLISDLQHSRELQRAFDTSDEAKERFNTRNRFFWDDGFYGIGRRGFRMGYYAATALLARTALYAGENSLALSCASELVEDRQMLLLSDPNDIESGDYTRLLSDGFIFMLYNKDFEQSFNGFNFHIANVLDIFGNDTDDFRNKCYLSRITDNNYELKKYTVIPSGNEGILREGKITSAIPMIRLSEMYHIMIEVLYDSDRDAAIELFDELRWYRGCKSSQQAATTKDMLLNQLVNDARREFMGEGQLFFMYKRLDRQVLDERRGHQTLGDKFVLPIPERESGVL